MPTYSETTIKVKEYLFKKSRFSLNTREFDYRNYKNETYPSKHKTNLNTNL